jgi:hypothetical protein
VDNKLLKNCITSDISLGGNKKKEEMKKTLKVESSEIGNSTVL